MFIDDVMFVDRSLCSLVCKWAYTADAVGNMGWDESFLKQVGLEDLINNDFAKIGKKGGYHIYHKYRF